MRQLVSMPMLFAVLILSVPQAVPGVDGPAAAQGDAPGQSSSRGAERDAGERGGVQVERDETAGTTKFTFELAGGRLSWRQILAALARREGFDDAALPGISGRTIDLSGRGGRWTLLGLNIAFSRIMQFRLAGRDSLEILVDDATLLATRRRLGRKLRERLTRSFSASTPRYGLSIDEGWRETPDGAGMVVGVHGLASTGDRFEHLFKDIRAKGTPCASFVYANDRPIAESARELSRALAKLRAEDDQRPISLVAHSMGGLVAREAIENPELDPGGVKRLILVAVPNRGSKLAHFAFGLEVWEHLVLRERQSPVERFYSAIEDGLGEAHRDLRPGSRFLRTLNARPRHADVRYSLFLGSGAPCEEGVLENLRTWVQREKEHRVVRFLGPKLDGYLSDLDEIVREKGDGAVAIRRGKLAGVADTTILEFHHVGVWKTSDPLRREILRRLEAP